MKINQSNINQWSMKPATAQLDIDLNQVSAQEFKQFLLKLSEQFNTLSINPFQLSFESDLTNEQYLELISHIKKNANFLPFSKLILSVGPAIVSGQGFKDLVEVLNHSSIQQLHLKVGTTDAAAEEITTLLKEQVGESIHYPVTIDVPSLGYNLSFTKQIISNIQKHNVKKLSGDDKIEGFHTAPVESDEPDTDPLARKIKLKELIQLDKTQSKNSYDPYIKLEVQHIEIVEEIQEEVIEVIEEQQ